MDSAILAAASPFSVKVEAYPDARRIIALGMEKHPHLDWQQRSVVPFEDLVMARKGCLTTVWGEFDSKGKLLKSSPKNVTDYGKVVAARLEPKVYTGTESLMEWFNEVDTRHGQWQVSKKTKALTRMVRNALEQEFRESRSEYEVQPDGNRKLVQRRAGPIPANCKRQDLYHSVTSDVELTLMRTIPQKSL